jgi:hypothetical protein
MGPRSRARLHRAACAAAGPRHALVGGQPPGGGQTVAAVPEGRRRQSITEAYPSIAAPKARCGPTRSHADAVGHVVTHQRAGRDDS